MKAAIPVPEKLSGRAAFSGFLKGLSLKYKLLIFCFLIIFIPILLIGYFFINKITAIILDQSTNESTVSVLQITDNLRNAVKLAEDMSDLIYLNKALNWELSRKYDNPGQSADVYIDILTPFISNNRELHPALIKAITIYLDNESFLQNGGEIKLATAEVKQQQWYRNTVDKKVKGYRFWSGPVSTGGEGSEGTFGFSLYRKLDSLGKSIGVLEILVKEEYFNAMLQKENPDKKLIIVNPSGVVISSNDRGLIGSMASDLDYLHSVYDSTNGNYESHSPKMTYKVIFDTASTTGSNKDWKVISIIPVELLLEKVYAARNLGITICILCFIVLAAMILVFSRSFTGRIRRLVEKTRKVVEGDYTEPLDVVGEDEIGKLGFSFNKMLKHLNELINEVYEDKIKMQEYRLKQKETELLALQNQINPHFLYNTLDAIRMHALISEGESISDMLVSLSSLLRYSISGGKEVVTIRDELQHLSNYISLMKIRYEDALEYEMEIEEEILDSQILKLVLQPLVENAITHGIRKKSGKGRVKVSGGIDSSRLTIEIEDDGVGIPEDRLRQLNEALGQVEETSETGGRIGLYNVNNRIKLYFGGDYGLEIVSCPGKGTRVRLRLPYKERYEHA